MHSALWLLRPIATGELHSPATTTDRGLAALPSVNRPSQRDFDFPAFPVGIGSRRLRPVRRAIRSIRFLSFPAQRNVEVSIERDLGFDE